MSTAGSVFSAGWKKRLFFFVFSLFSYIYYIGPHYFRQNDCLKKFYCVRHVYDVLDDYIVHASFQRYLASERSAALEHLHNLEDLNIYQNSVVIFDRGYYSEDMFRYCVEHQHLCLMRLKNIKFVVMDASGCTRLIASYSNR